MIFDNITNCERYYGINDKFEKAFEFIKKAIDENMQVGRYEIDGEEVYAIVDSYTTRYEENCRFEAHRRYIDIQCMIDGCEVMKSVYITKAASNEAYDDGRDVEFFENCNDACASVVAGGEFAIFYPEDVHMPGKAFLDIPKDIKKVIIKIKV